MNFLNTVEISVIIPVYNTEKYLEKCLESIKEQTFQNWEAICINDGSTDNSLHILQKTAQEDKRFIIKEQSNQGVASARNTGLEIASGKYIMFLDSDDFIHPQCLEIAHDTLTKAQADICDFKLQKVKENQNIVHPHLPTRRKLKLIEKPLQKIIRGKEASSLLTVWKKLYKAELAKKVKFRPIPVGEDILYSLELMDYVEKCVQISDILIYYLQRNSSVSHEKDEIKRYNRRILLSQHLTELIKNLCRKYSQTAFEKDLLCYLSCYLFNVYTRRIYRLHIPNIQEKLSVNMKTLNNFEKQQLFNPNLLNLRFRIMFWLLQHQHYGLASLIA